MPTVLVVEDDQDLCNALRELCEDEGFTAFAAYDAAQALAVSEVYPVDVVLSDLNMPKMNGVELYERMSGMQAVGMFVLTSTTRPRNWPMDRPFLQKPIDFDRLVRMVRSGVASVPKSSRASAD